jgi:hypothetical protein
MDYVKNLRLTLHENFDIGASRPLPSDDNLLIFYPQAQYVIVCVIVVKIYSLNMISEPMALLILEMNWQGGLRT